MTQKESLFKKAERRAVRLKLAITGPSGSGKTLAALAVAEVLAAGGRIAVVDTENESASLYADRYTFDTLPLSPPYLTKKYLEALEAAIEERVSVLVIDSLSHQWEGDGGILQRKDEADQRPGSNHWTNWGPFTKEHNEFRAALLNAPIHVIATMRSKMAYQQTESGGKKKVEKLGLQPIQREGMEYEFTTTWDIGMDHLAVASKDRTGIFDKPVNLVDPKHAKKLLEWLDTAPAPGLISEIQRKRLGVVVKNCGVPEAAFREIVLEHAGVTATKDIPLERYDAVVDAVENYKKDVDASTRPLDEPPPASAKTETEKQADMLFGPEKAGVR